MSFSGDGSIVCVESCGAGGFGAIINVILPPACALSASASVCDTVNPGGFPIFFSAHGISSRLHTMMLRNQNL